MNVLSWFERVRPMRVSTAFVTVLVGSAIARIVLVWGTGGRAISWNALVFQTWPFAVVCTAITTAVFVIGNRERLERATGTAAISTLMGISLGVIASWTGWWSDGTTGLLSSGLAWSSVLWGGLYPSSVGPDAFIRFIPIVSALLVAVRLHLYRASPQRVLGLSAITLATMHVVIFLPSLLAGIIGLFLRLGTGTSDEAYRTLLTVSSNGYWSLFAPDRFQSLAGQQSLFLIQALHVVVLAVSCAVIIAVTMHKLVPGFWRVWVSRMQTESHRHAGWLIVIAWAIATLTRSPLRLVPDLFALAWWVCLLGCWFTWSMWKRDLRSVSEDASAHPEYWIPSGRISVHVMEEALLVLQGVLLIGVLFLGLPVAIPVWVVLAVEEVIPSAKWRQIVSIAGMSLATFFVSQKDMVAPAWELWILGSTVITILLAERLPEWLATRSERSRFALAPACLLLGAAISDQPIIWMSAVPLIVGMFFVAWRKPDLFSRWLPFFFEILVGLEIFLLFVFPRFFEH